MDNLSFIYIRDTSTKDSRPFFRSAVVEHLRCWWASDGLYHSRIWDSNGKIHPPTVRQIFISYGVNRGLRKGQETELADLLTDKLKQWPDSLRNRAELTRQIAEQASEKITKGVLLSGMSKVIWFAKPTGWTLYDSFARRGLGSSSYKDGSNDYEKYYNKLATLNFHEVMESARSVISQSRFPYLWPERIHDKYLMLCGHEEENNRVVIKEKEHEPLLCLWKSFFGPSLIKDIDDLVDTLTSTLLNAEAFQVHQLKQELR